MRQQVEQRVADRCAEPEHDTLPLRLSRPAEESDDQRAAQERQQHGRTRLPSRLFAQEGPTRQRHERGVGVEQHRDDRGIRELEREEVAHRGGTVAGDSECRESKQIAPGNDQRARTAEHRDGREQRCGEHEAPGEQRERGGIGVVGELRQHRQRGETGRRGHDCCKRPSARHYRSPQSAVRWPGTPAGGSQTVPHGRRLVNPVMVDCSSEFPCRGARTG